MSTKKKILLLTDWYEPGYKAGGPIQSCKNFVSALYDEFDLTVITSDRDKGDTEPYPDIVTDTWISRDPGFRIYYAGPATVKGGLLKGLIADIAPDYIYLNSMYSYQFTILPLWWKIRKHITGEIVIAPRGMLHEGALQIKTLKKKVFIKFLRATGFPRRLVFQATDEQERKDILKYFPATGKVMVVPNFAKMEVVEWKSVRKEPGELHCVFIARMASNKNLLFLLNVLKDLCSDLRLRLSLYGEIVDADYWEKCRSVIEALPSSVSVTWKGLIPNQAVTGVLQQHHIFILPTLGENFGHAIFEALLAGKPVLISDKTPWRNLSPIKVGWDLPLEIAAFSETIRDFAAMDQVTYDEWSGSAFRYARELQKNDGLKEKYRKLFQ